MSTLLRRLQDDPVYNSQHVSQLMKITNDEDSTIYDKNELSLTVKHGKNFIVVTKTHIMWFNEKLEVMKKIAHKTNLISEVHTALVFDDTIYMFSKRYIITLRSAENLESQSIAAKKSPYIINDAAVIDGELLMLTNNSLMKLNYEEAIKTDKEDLRFLLDTEKFTYLIDWKSSTLTPLEKIQDQSNRLYFTYNDSFDFEMNEISRIMPIKMKSDVSILTKTKYSFGSKYLHFDSPEYMYTDSHGFDAIQFIHRDDKYRYFLNGTKIMKCPSEVNNLSKATEFRPDIEVHAALNLSQSNIGFVVKQDSNWFVFTGSENLIDGSFAQNRPFYNQDLDIIGIASESFGVDTLSIFSKVYKSPSHKWNDYKMMCLVVYFTPTKNPKLEWLQGYTQDQLDIESNSKLVRVTRYPGSSEQLTIELCCQESHQLAHYTAWNAQFNNLSVKAAQKEQTTLISDLIYENGEVELPNFEFDINFHKSNPEVSKRDHIYTKKDGTLSSFCNEWKILSPILELDSCELACELYRSSCIHNSVMTGYNLVSEKMTELYCADLEDKGYYLA